MTPPRTHVFFRTSRFSMTERGPSHPDYEDELILGEDCARWLIDQLPTRGVFTDPEPCWEDWGWEVFASVAGCRFWIGMSPEYSEGNPPEWTIHVHHVRLLQRFTRRGRRAIEEVTAAIDSLLRDDTTFEGIRWYREALNLDRETGGAQRPDAP